MSVRRLTDNKWDQRIDRVRELAEKYPFATQVLTFYSKLTAFQKSFYLHLQSVMGGTGPDQIGAGSQPVQGTVRSDCATVDLGLLNERWAPFLSMIECEAPSALAEFARGLKGWGSDACNALLRSVWPGTRRTATVGAPLVGAHHTTDSPQGATTRVAPTFERFCALAFLQPYAEFLAERADVPAPAVRRPICPYCGSLPLVGALRQEGEGGKRSLVCSFCRTEWDYLRIACAACEERREEKLCVYSTPAFEGVRVEACDSCHAYIKTVDLTQNGLAVPEVDELAAMPLSLWAEEQGYKKVTPNIIGL